MAVPQHQASFKPLGAQWQPRLITLADKEEEEAFWKNLQLPEGPLKSPNAGPWIALPAWAPLDRVQVKP